MSFNFRLGPLLVSFGNEQRRVWRVWLPDGLHVWWHNTGLHAWWGPGDTPRLVWERVKP